MKTSRPGPTPSLTIPGIAAAAVAIADAEGLDAVTMRSVAAAVGTSAAALYRYVSSREDLLGHMVDVVSAELRHPAPSGDWRSDLIDVGEQQLALHTSHPWLRATSSLPLTMGVHVLDHLEWGIVVLNDLDVPAGAKMEAIALVNGVAALFATVGPAVGAESFRNLDPGRHIGLARLLSTAEPGPPSGNLFPRVLRGILDSVLGS